MSNCVRKIQLVTEQPHIDENGVFQTLEIWDHDVDPRIEDSEDRVSLNWWKKAVEVSGHSYGRLFDQFNSACMQAIIHFQEENKSGFVSKFAACVGDANLELGRAWALCARVKESPDEVNICEFLFSVMKFQFRGFELRGMAEVDVNEREFAPLSFTRTAQAIRRSAENILVSLLSHANVSVELFLAYRECWWAFKQLDVDHKGDIEYELELYQRSWYDEEFGGKQDE